MVRINKQTETSGVGKNQGVNEQAKVDQSKINNMKEILKSAINGKIGTTETNTGLAIVQTLKSMPKAA